MRLLLRDLEGEHAVVEIGDRLPVGDCKERPCRCGPLRVSETSSDVVLDSGDCQIARLVGFAEYLACESDGRQSWRFEEISAGCVPQLELTAALRMATESRAVLEVALGVGDLPLGNQSVRLFERAGAATLGADSATTASDGRARVELSAPARAGELVVTANAEAVYSTQLAAANGETFTGPERRKEVLAESRVIVVEAPTPAQPPEPGGLEVKEGKIGAVGAVRAKLSINDIVGGVKANASTVVPCLETARGQGEILPGSHKLIRDWQIMPDGTVANPRLTGPAGVLETSRPACFADKMKAWKFPASVQGAPIRNFPFGPITVK